jgi:hypothetical protein
MIDLAKEHLMSREVASDDSDALDGDAGVVGD